MTGPHPLRLTTCWWRKLPDPDKGVLSITAIVLIVVLVATVLWLAQGAGS